MLDVMPLVGMCIEIRNSKNGVFCGVMPLVGMCIEIGTFRSQGKGIESCPLWACVLKFKESDFKQLKEQSHAPCGHVY